jgi:hypothetical protein
MATAVFSETFVNNCTASLNKRRKFSMMRLNLTVDFGQLCWGLVKRQGISWLRRGLIARFWCLKAALLTIQVFWDTASSRLLNSHGRFERSDCICVQDQAIAEWFSYTPCFGCFNLGKNPGTQCMGSCLGVRSQGAENLAPTGFRSQDGQPVALRYSDPQLKRTTERVKSEGPGIDLLSLGIFFFFSDSSMCPRGRLSL